MGKGLPREPVSRMPEYRVYRQMLDRCYLTTAKNYRYYGARGISVCDRWRFGVDGDTGFQTFLSDMGRRPDGLTLDRRDADGDYEPANCRWASWAVQHANKRVNKMTEDERQLYWERRADRVRGERSPVAKLNDAKVALMKRKMLDGARTSDLAREFGVSPQTVSGIRVCREWTHVEASHD